MSVNRFVLNETSYFGKGAREELPEEIRKRKFNKVLVVTDKALAECGVTSRVTEVLVSMVLVTVPNITSPSAEFSENLETVPESSERVLMLLRASPFTTAAMVLAPFVQVRLTEPVVAF